MSKVCPKCERIVGDGVDICPLCGTRISQGTENDNVQRNDGEDTGLNENLFLCPDCGKPVSKLAFSCPNCGRPLRDNPVPKQEIKIENKKENSGCGAIIGIVIGTLLLLWGLSDILKLFK